VVGLLIPGAILDWLRLRARAPLLQRVNVALTGFVLTAAFVKRGLSRRSGLLVIAGYGVFVVWLLAIS